MFLRKIFTTLCNNKLDTDFLKLSQTSTRFHSSLRTASYHPSDSNEPCTDSIESRCNNLVHSQYPQLFLEQVESYESYRNKPLIKKLCKNDTRTIEEAYKNFLRVSYNTFKIRNGDTPNPSRII